jgi:hypothetical protein
MPTMRIQLPSLLALAFPVIVGAASRSFDPNTGRLAVDMPAYMSKHQIAFNSPITDSTRGVPLGNGRVGAMIWNTNGLTMQVSGVDASPQGELSAGRIKFNTNPAIDANSSKFQEVLSLYDGSLDIQYVDGRAITLFGIPNSEVIGIHVVDARTNVQSATLDLGVWDASSATYMTTRWGQAFNSMMGDLTNQSAWSTISTLVETADAGISRGQSDADGFGYTLAAAVEGTAFTTSQVDSRNVRLAITPAKSYTIYLVCASRKDASGGNSVTAAKQALAAAVAKGYAANRQASLDWWHEFWGRSFVQYSTTAGDADYLENYYYLCTYIVGAGAFGSYPFHFINGIYHWNYDADVHWSGGYWYWNSRDVYNGFLPANHPEAMHAFYRTYSAALPKMTTYTQSKFSKSGVWVPETMRWDGDAKYTNGSDYTQLIYSTGAEMSMNMFHAFKYTNDSAFLRDTAYPFMKASATFLQNMLTNSGSEYYMATSNAHETYWKVKNAITDLAAVRQLFPKLIEASNALGLDASSRSGWQDVLNKLHPYQTTTVNGATQWLPYDGSGTSPSSNNVENITCEMAWPYEQTGAGMPNVAIGTQSYKTRPFAYNQIWSPDPIQAARLGLGDEAFNGMKKMVTTYQNYPNGFTNNTNGTFEYIGTHIQSINESLLHSWNDTIRVFPAAPSTTTFTGRFTLLAHGGFLVTSEKVGADILYVGVKSQQGGKAVVYNPWGTAAIQVVSEPDGAVLASGSSSSIAFSTTKGGAYVVERTATPFSSFTASTLTGTANWSSKQVSYNGASSSLGTGSGSQIQQTVGVAGDRSEALGTVRWSAGVLSVPGLEKGKLEVLDLRGRSREVLEIRHGEARTSRLEPGLYVARQVGEVGAPARFLVSP